MAAVVAGTALFATLTGEAAPVTVRVVTADERKACKYLGLVTAHTSAHADNPGWALRKALSDVAKLGGDSLYIVGQSQDVLNGASISGEALRCSEAAKQEAPGQ